LPQTQIAIIGGSGLYSILERSKTQWLTTPFGGSAPIRLGELSGKSVAFLNRHQSPNRKVTSSHTIPPHAVNYRANLLALRQLGVRYVLVTTAVGSLREKLPPGQLVIPDQLIDLTQSRVSTFYDGTTTFEIEGKTVSGVAHIDVTNPFCSTLRQILLAACKERGFSAADSATYAAMEGPRFETAAEIKMLRQLGADIVGMTLAPEAFLARELGMCYAACSVATNYAAGLVKTPITHEETLRTFQSRIEQVQEVLRLAIQNLPPIQSDCNCYSVWESATHD
ncbi:MAG: S-methyl-5'-thioinosine phosphorylase, partial [Candidatus Hermodarchaeota archaeon]